MVSFFKPYEGSNPYVFVSYSHRDSETVIDTIRLVHDRRYRLWYDEGIPAGSDWPRNIAVHMRDCRMVLFFLSRTALESPNCLSEMTTAARQGKPVLLMKLEDIPEKEYPPRWRDCLRNAVRLEPGTTAADRAEHILRCPRLTDDFLGTEEEFETAESGRGKGGAGVKIAMLAAAVLLIAALAGIAALYLGWVSVPGAPAASPPPTVSPSPTPEPSPPPTEVPTPEPTPEPTVFITPEPTVYYSLTEAERDKTIAFTENQAQEERVIRRKLDTTEEIRYRQLEEIEEIYFVGTMAPASLAGVEIDGEGRVTVNGPEVKAGSVSNLDLITPMAGLRKLALIKQPVRNVSGLNRLMRLREVNLACSEVSTVAGLTDLPSLYLLNLAHTKVKDLTPLADLPSLAEVVVSVDMIPLKIPADSRFEVILVP